MNLYRTLGVNKKTAKPGDLLNAQKMMSSPLMKKYKKPKKDAVKEEKKETKEEKKIEKKRGKIAEMKESKKFKKPKLGSGKRFAQLTSKLSAKGAKNPKALAAFIGRKKFGKKRFQQLAAKGK